MYWNNPTIKVHWPSDQDPIQQSQHGGLHCLFHDPAVPRWSIRYQQTLQDICNWANSYIQRNGVEAFVNDQRNHYDIANIVKLNMWIADIRGQGIVKPVMLFYDGQEQYGINNGESRLRALERVGSITTLNGFISTTTEHRDRFAHLTEVTSFTQFAEICGAVPGQEFQFTLTDPAAPYGIFWYEYDSERTRLVTPGEATCVATLEQYLTAHPGVEFSPTWFDTLVAWDQYGLSFS
jgi:cold shock CspA family protein